MAVDHYNVYRNGGSTPIAQPTTNSYSDTGRDPETEYTYRVSAVDAEGNESALSDPASATTQAESAGGTLDAISSRSPELYLVLDESSGTPADSSGNALTVQLNGTPSAYGVAMNDGPGLNLGGAADIQIPHDAVFNTDSGGAHDYTESEPTFTIRAIINESLRPNIYIYGKGDEDTNWVHTFAAYIMGDGSVRVITRAPEHLARLTTLDSPGGIVSQGTEFSLSVALGRDGLRAWVNGRKLFGNPRNFYGLEHRLLNSLNRNTGNIRIGITQGGSRSDITVNHFATFFRDTHGQRLQAADMEAIAGTTGAEYDHPIWGQQTVVADETDLQSQINSVSGSGDNGGTVDYQGTGTINADITLRSNVRLKLSNTLDLADGRHFRAETPSASSFTLASNASSGDTSIQVSSSAGMSSGDVIALESTTRLEELYLVSGASVQQTASNIVDYVVIQSISGTTVNLDRPLVFSYPTADVRSSSFWTPTKDIAVVGPGAIHSHWLNGSNTSSFLFAEMWGMLRAYIDAEIGHVETGEWNILGMQTAGDIDTHFASNALIFSEASDPEYGHNGNTSGSNTGHHPYPIVVAGSRNLTAKGAHFRGRGWHPDVSADNVVKDELGASNAQLHAPHCVEFVDVTLESYHDNLQWTSHLCSSLRWFGCQTPTGLIGFAGYRNEINGFTSRADGADGGTRHLGWGFNCFHTGFGNGYMANMSFLDTDGSDFEKGPEFQWFFARSASSWANSVHANISRASGSSPTHGPQATFEGNTYSNVDSPLPSA